MMWLENFADSDSADQDKVDAAATSLPTSTGIGTTVVTSEGILFVKWKEGLLSVTNLKWKTISIPLKPLTIILTV